MARGQGAASSVPEKHQTHLLVLFTLGSATLQAAGVQQLLAKDRAHPSLPQNKRHDFSKSGTCQILPHWPHRAQPLALTLSHL